MFIAELFNRPVQYEFTKDLSYKMIAEFRIDDYNYEVHVKGEGLAPGFTLGGPIETFDNVWEASFTTSFEHDTQSSYKQDQVTGTGNAIAVFSTVIDIINEAVAQKNIQHIYFSAMTTEPSRVKLYNRLAKHYAKEGWRYIDDKEIRARSGGDDDRYTTYYLLTKQPHPHSKIR